MPMCLCVFVLVRLALSPYFRGCVHSHWKIREMEIYKNRYIFIFFRNFIRNRNMFFDLGETILCLEIYFSTVDCSLLLLSNSILISLPQVPGCYRDLSRQAGRCDLVPALQCWLKSQWLFYC